MTGSAVRRSPGAQRQDDPVVGLLEPAQIFVARARIVGGGLVFEVPGYVANAGWEWPGATDDAMTLYSSVELRVRWAKAETSRIRFRVRLAHSTLAVWLVRTGQHTWTIMWSAYWDETVEQADPQVMARSGNELLASVLVSDHGEIVWSNKKFRALADLSGSGRGLGLPDVLPSDMAGALGKVVADVAAGGVVDRLLPSIQPGPHWLRVHASPAPRPDAEDTLIAIQFEEVMSRHDAEPAVVDQLVRDPLTELYNRRALFDIADLDDPQGSSFTSVVLVDVRRFRSINDVWGQLAADDCLIAVARWLEANTGDGDIVVRLVGDQFLVLASGDTGLVDRIVDKGELTLTRGRHQIPVVLQAGWALRSPGQRLLVTAERAERALEAAKQASTARVVQWTEQLARATSARIREEETVRRAISGGDVTVFFQPLVDVAAGRLKGMEALVRLEGAGSAISAERVIAATQQLGLTSRLNEEICARAFSEAIQLQQVYPGMHVAVNLSREIMSTGEAIDTVLSAAEEAGLAPADIWIELTEEFAVGVSSSTLMSELRRAADHGLAIVIDDFGRGETALSMLRSLPLTAIKLDRSLLPADSDESGWRFVEGTVSLLRTLAPQLVAEGVETPAQARRLRDIGVPTQQGYLFGAPQPAPFWIEHPEKLRMLHWD